MGKKISELAAASALDGTELVPVVQGGTTKRATAADVLAYSQTAYPLVASFAWDTSTSSPAAVGGAVRKVTAIHAGMRRCVVNDAGVVQYYLLATDSTKKADGSAANIDGTDGQVMVEIPRFYIKREVNGPIWTWSISAVPLTGYTVHPAFVKDGIEVPYRYYGAYDAALYTTKAITGITQANPAVVTCTGHGLVTGDVVTLSGIEGMVELNGQTVTVTYVDADTFSIGVDSTGYTAYSAGGAWAGILSGLNLDNASARYVAGSSKLASVSGKYPIVGLTRAQCRVAAANRGTIWRQLDFALWSAVQLLYLIEYQSFYSQNILGAGNTNGSYIASSSNQTDSPHTVAGASNARGNGSTNVTTGAGASAKPGTSYMSYRGIENFYGNAWNWADGINVNVGSNGNVHVTNNRADFADDTSTNMTLLTAEAPTSANYASAIAALDGYFVPTSVAGGSSSTYLTDYWYGSTSSNRVALVGGSADYGANAGAFCVAATHGSSIRARAIGARLAA